MTKAAIIVVIAVVCCAATYCVIFAARSASNLTSVSNDVVPPNTQQDVTPVHNERVAATKPMSQSASTSTVRIVGPDVPSVDRTLRTIDGALAELSKPDALGKQLLANAVTAEMAVRSGAYNPRRVQVDSNAIRELETLLEAANTAVAKAFIAHQIELYSIERKLVLSGQFHDISSGPTFQTELETIRTACPTCPISVRPSSDNYHNRIIMTYPGEWPSLNLSLAELSNQLTIRLEVVRMFIGRFDTSPVEKRK